MSYTSNTNVGTATANACFAGDATHTRSSDTKTFTITKAGSTTTVTCPTNVTYTGSALTPCTAAATGAGGLNQSLTVSYSNNTNAGTAYGQRHLWRGRQPHRQQRQQELRDRQGRVDDHRHLRRRPA